jgi:pimeloyl-ACP methyl ester carboxylesterase
MTALDIASQDAATLETAPTRYIEGSGIRFAYRRLGPSTGTPLVLLQHFSGNIDAWDPAVVNALAAGRPVIAFDNVGVGRSTGQTPDNIAAMARDAVAFINLLGLSEVDLLGFSLGGFVAQQIAAEHGPLVRKLVLVGTAPKVERNICWRFSRRRFPKPMRQTLACRCSSRSRPPAGHPAWRS